jgi:hypothetical protein
MTSNALPSNITHMGARNTLRSQGLAFYLNSAQCPATPSSPAQADIHIFVRYMALQRSLRTASMAAMAESRHSGG